MSSTTPRSRSASASRSQAKRTRHESSPDVEEPTAASIVGRLNQSTLKKFIFSNSPSQPTSRETSPNKFFDAKFMNTLMERITAVMETTIEEKLHEIKVDFERMREENIKMKRRLESMEGEMSQQREVIEVLKRNSNNLEQYSRRNNFRIVGMKEGRGEKEEEAEEKVLAMVKDKLNIALISKSDIDAAHRVGKPNKNGYRQIIVKCVRRKHRDQILAARRKLKGSGIMIIEDLTQGNQRLLTSVRENALVERAWSTNGQVSCLTRNGKKIKIDPKEDITHQIK